MKTRLAWVLGMGLLVACSKETATAPPKKTSSTDLNNNSSGNPITAPVDYLGAVAKAKKTAVKVIDVSSLKQTIMLFNEQEGRYPKDLNELITMHYVPQLPAPP